MVYGKPDERDTNNKELIISVKIIPNYEYIEEEYKKAKLAISRKYFLAFCGMTAYTTTETGRKMTRNATEKNIIYYQSHVPQHAELAWILNCYTYMGELNRMTQFKDKCAKNADNINGGLFTYPSLMAADILLYQADYVPVGEDQRQHCELTRDIAVRFNNIYGETFKVPEAYIPKAGARVMGLGNPTSKMSKSDPNGCVFLMEKPEDIARKFKRAITDSDTENCVRFDPENKPGVSNLMNIYSAVTGKSIDEIEREFEGQGYGVFKPAVGDAVIETLRPIREEATRLLNDKAYLCSVYTEGAQKASVIARKTLRKVYKKVGLVEKPF